MKQLSLKFEENVRDDRKKFEKLITDKKETKGLSDVVLQRAAQIAKSKVFFVESFGYLIIILFLKFLVS